MTTDRDRERDQDAPDEEEAPRDAEMARDEETGDDEPEMTRDDETDAARDDATEPPPKTELAWPEADGEEADETEEAPKKEYPPYTFDRLPDRVQENLKAMDWKEPMPVQASVVPVILDGEDVIVQSRTGSGKTGAFTLPLFHRVDPRRKEVQALILVPTRELAEQVHKVVREMAEGTGLTSVAVYGGVGYGPQIEAFKQNVHVIVATPGRMIDHLMSRRVNLGYLRYLVLDEADEMLSMGFFESMAKILSYLPSRRQTLLFSATIPPGVASLGKRFTRDAEWLSLSSDVLHVEEVDHIYYVEEAMYKDRALLKLIEMENPEAALIFCNTKKEVEYLGVFLQNFGYDGDFLSGDLSQKERDRVMARIREGKLRFLVATDVAARGIDISDLGYVILYSLPQAHDHYIHRAGRTGRAGEGGTAISLVSPIEERELQKRAAFHGLSLIKRDVPTDEEVEKRVAERLRNLVEEGLRSRSNLEIERQTRFVAIAKDLMKDEVNAELFGMLLDRFYQESLNRPLYPRQVEMKERATRGGPRGGRGRGDRGRGGDRSRGGDRGRGGDRSRRGGDRKGGRGGRSGGGGGRKR